MSLKDSKTEQNLKDAFAGESQANRRYLYFAAKADVEGYNDVAAVFRSTAEGETGHAHGHLEYLEETGDPATGLPIGGTENNLKAFGKDVSIILVIRNPRSYLSSIWSQCCVFLPSLHKCWQWRTVRPKKSRRRRVC